MKKWKEIELYTFNDSYFTTKLYLTLYHALKNHREYLETQLNGQICPRNNMSNLWPEEKLKISQKYA